VLLGATPSTTVIEKNTLTAFYNITRYEDFIEHEIALRQLAIKDENSNSWFTHIRKLLQKYNLPTAYEIMGNPPTKGQWKELTKEHVRYMYVSSVAPRSTYVASVAHLSGRP
jgi:hypothetical protein